MLKKERKKERKKEEKKKKKKINNFKSDLDIAWDFSNRSCFTGALKYFPLHQKFAPQETNAIENKTKSVTEIKAIMFFF